MYLQLLTQAKQVTPFCKCKSFKLTYTYQFSPIITLMLDNQLSQPYLMVNLMRFLKKSHSHFNICGLLVYIRHYCSSVLHFVEPKHSTCLTCPELARCFHHLLRISMECFSIKLFIHIYFNQGFNLNNLEKLINIYVYELKVCIGRGRSSEVKVKVVGC